MNNVEKYTKNINILSQSVESTENVYLISEPKIKPKILLHLDPELTITLDPLSFKHFLKTSKTKRETRQLLLLIEQAGVMEFSQIQRRARNSLSI